MSAALEYEQMGEVQVATFLAARLRDRRLTLELAARAIRHAQWTGDRMPLMLLLGLAAGAIAHVRPDAAVRMREVVDAIGSAADGGGSPGLWVPVDVDEAASYAISEIAAALADPDLVG